METKVISVFYDNLCLPYKDKDRQVHYPIVGNAFLGASNTTKIRFYFDYIGNVNTTWVSVAKLPNGKQGSKVLPIASDENGNYAELELSNWYTQAKGDVYIALQGYQGGVEYSYDSETELYEIHGTPTIQTTGSIKLAINYAPIGDSPDYTDEFTTYQEILAALGDKASLESVVLGVNLSDYPTYQELLDYVGTRPFAFILNDELRFGVFQHDSENDTYSLKIFDNSGIYVTDTLNLSDSTSTIEQQIAQIEFATDNVIELTSLMGTLTNKQLQQATKNNAYIKYNNNYYRKDTDGGTTEFVRYVVVLASSGTSIQIKKTYFNVNTTSGYYVYLETIFDTYTSTWASNLINAKQDRLVSGTNIKTINGQSILGSGDLPIQGGGGSAEWGEITGDIQDQTDLQNELQDIREVAEGKTNTFSVDTDTSGNSGFKSDNEIITITSFVDVNGNTINVSELNVGDLVYTLNTQTNKYKDRWLIDNVLCTWGLIDADTPNLSGYATKTELSDAIGSVNDNIAHAYDNTVIYSIGDKVINEDGELVTCLVNMTQAEDYDSTHWMKITVASGFVDLDKAQVITGEKTLETSLVFNEQNSTFSYFLEEDNYGQFLIGTKAGATYTTKFVFDVASFSAYQNNSLNLGNNTNKWKDLYLSGKAYVDTISSSSGNTIMFTQSNGTTNLASITPWQFYSTVSKDLGMPSYKWKDLYLSGNISDGTNSVSVADLANLIAYAKSQGWIS